MLLYKRFLSIVCVYIHIVEGNGAVIILVTKSHHYYLDLVNCLVINVISVNAYDPYTVQRREIIHIDVKYIHRVNMLKHLHIAATKL